MIDVHMRTHARTHYINIYIYVYYIRPASFVARSCLNQQMLQPGVFPSLKPFLCHPPQQRRASQLMAWHCWPQRLLGFWQPVPNAP